MSREQREKFHRSLPTKRMAAGCVLRNRAGEIVVVKPTYKDYWELPGGAVEDDESLWDACRREVREELGVDLVSASLLCVDYCSSQPGYVESLMFLFDGGVLDQDTIERIRVHHEELSEANWVPPRRAIEMLGDRVSRRLNAVLSLLGTGRSIYLEDQRLNDTPSRSSSDLFVDECPFCSIAANADSDGRPTRPEVVLRDGLVTAFVSTHQWPNKQPNVLVIPNQHFESIFDLPDEVALKVHRGSRRVAAALVAAFGCEGISIRQNNLPAGGQDIAHYHVHVTPRYQDDGGAPTSAGKALIEREVQASFAVRLRAQLAAP